MIKFLLIFITFSCLLALINCILPTTKDSATRFSGDNIQTGNRRLLRLMTGFSTSEILTIDMARNQIKSLDYLNFQGNPLLLIPFQAFDFIILPNNTAVFLGTGDGINLTLYLADIWGDDFDRGLLGLGYPIETDIKLAPFYPLRDPAVELETYFIVYFNNVLRIYGEKLDLINELNNYVGTFISILPFAERSMLISTSLDGKINLWTYAFSKSDIFSYFIYDEIINVSSYVFIEKLKGSNDRFMTMTNNSNLIRIWSIDQRKNILDITATINGTGVISLDNSIIIIFNSLNIEYIDINSDTRLNNAFPEGEIHDLVSLPVINGIKSLFILRKDGSFLSVTSINLTNQNCCTYSPLPLTLTETLDFYQNDEIYISTNLVDVNGQRAYAFIKFVGNTLIYFWTSDLIQRTLTLPKNITLVTFIRETAPYDLSSLAINFEGSISFYTVDTSTNQYVLSQEFSIPAATSQQGAVLLFNESTGLVTGYLLVSTSMDG